MADPAERPYIHIMPLEGIAYDVAEFLKPSDKLRDTFTPNHYLCLPLTAANTLGWTLYNPFEFTAVWLGGDEKERVVVTCDQAEWVGAMFGYGTFTIYLNFLVETSPGIDLLVRPVPNHWKLPVMPFDGIVETDWLDASFTVNFRLTLPMIKAKFEVGEPLVQFVPYPRHFIEDFDAAILTSGERYDKRVASYRTWEAKRAHRIETQAGAGYDYTRGHHTDGSLGATDHKRTFRLKSFKPDTS